MTLTDEIKNILDPNTPVPMPVMGKENNSFIEIIRVQNALIRLAIEIDKQNEILQSIYKTSEKVLIGIGRMDERIDELDEKLGED